MGILIYLDYAMMEQGRLLSQIKSQPMSKIDYYGKRQRQVTNISLFTIITTSVVSIAFVYFCLLALKIQPNL